MLLLCLKKRDLFESQGKNILQNLAKKIGLSVYGGKIRKERNEEYERVTETWMRENSNDRVKERFLLKSGNLIVKIEDGESADVYDKAKWVQTLSSHFGSKILSNSKRLKNDVIKQKGASYKISVYYNDTDSPYRNKKYWSDLIDNGFVGKSLDLGKNYYGDSGLFYAWFLTPKIKYCLVIDDFGVISAKHLFKDFFQEHRMRNWMSFYF